MAEPAQDDDDAELANLVGVADPELRTYSRGASAIAGSPRDSPRLPPASAKASAPALSDTSPRGWRGAVVLLAFAAGLGLGVALGHQLSLLATCPGPPPTIMAVSATTTTKTTTKTTMTTTGAKPAVFPKPSELFHSFDELSLAPWAQSELPLCTSADDATHGHWEGDRWVPWHCVLRSKLSPENKAKFFGKKLLIYGDSQGTHLANQLSGALGCKTEKSSGFPQCPQLSASALHRFFASSEPGVQYGCVECNGCMNMMFSCPGGTLIWSVVAEFFDQKSITSRQHPTLLQWLFRSFAAQYKFDYIVGNIGLHEITKVEKEANSLQPFIQRTAHASALLSELVMQGRKCLFILTGDVRRDKNMLFENITSPYHVHLINGIMRAQLGEHGVPVADPFRLARYEGDLHTLHSDRVHIHGKGGLYYKTLAHIILSTL